MTRIEGDFVFVHASDIQLLGDEAVSQILSWKPDIVFASGPPLYLGRLSDRQNKDGVGKCHPSFTGSRNPYSRPSPDAKP